MRKLIYRYFLIAFLAVISLLSFPGYCYSSSNPEKARNVILFIGDGMQYEHEIAASRYLTGQDNGLVWQSFPYRAFVSTWNIDAYNRYAYNLNKPEFSYEKFDPSIGYNPLLGGIKPYPEANNINNDYFLKPLSLNKLDIIPKSPATDSAASATAIATGIKTETGNISWLKGDLENGSIKTIAEIIKEKKDASIGIVTTVPFNHATPAAFTSHNTDRNNYYTEKKGYKEVGIADEIINIFQPDVVIGAGHPKFNKEVYMSKKLYKELLVSNDYIVVERKKGENASYKLLIGTINAINSNKKLFGLFGGKDGNFDFAQPQNLPSNPVIKRVTQENPTLADAVLAAIRVLSENDKGFFLMAEQGDIDWANHNNDYKSMIGSVYDLNEAVKSVIDFVNNPDDNIDWNNTLIIVTADHANSFMRLNNSKKLCKGCLPEQKRSFLFRNSIYPNKEVKYSLKDHTNELVNLYAIGDRVDLFKEYEGLWYPETNIIDNTHIFNVILKFMDIDNASDNKDKPFLKDNKN